MAAASYNAAQLRAIRKFQKVESKRLGRRLTNNEAALLWIDKGLSGRFRKAHKEQEKGDDR